MKAVCVDAAPESLALTVSLCEQLPQLAAVQGFTDPNRALAWAAAHPVELVVLETELPELSGIELARRLRQACPDMAVLFVTEHPQHALEAFSVHAAGYLLKPVTGAALAAEVAWALNGKSAPQAGAITIRTFGGFDVFVGEVPVHFKAAKSKELLAYLVDRRGGSVTRAQAFAALWEDRFYDRPMQKQLDVVIRRMRSSLQEAGAGQIFEMERGSLRVRPDLFSCDAYRFFEGDLDAVNAFSGEYMSAYSWASITESFLTWKWRGGD